MEDTNLQVSQKSGNIRDFIDSEEIDFGTEPPSQQTVNVEQESEPIVQEEDDIVPASEDQDVETEDLAFETEEPTEVTPSSDVNQEHQATKVSRKESSDPRLTQLPLSKIKSIMKFDPDVHIVSTEAIFLVTRAAELFVQTLAKESHTHTVASKKKTIVRRDVDMTIESVDTLMFLEGMMNV